MCHAGKEKLSLAASVVIVELGERALKFGPIACGAGLLLASSNLAILIVPATVLMVCIGVRPASD